MFCEIKLIVDRYTQIFFRVQPVNLCVYDSQLLIENLVDLFEIVIAVVLVGFTVIFHSLKHGSVVDLFLYVIGSKVVVVAECVEACIFRDTCSYAMYNIAVFALSCYSI